MRRKEIAARLGVSVNTVYSLLARIRLKTATTGKTR
jgi:excisionase family DNA binding protein